MVTEGLSLRFKRNKQKKKPISFLNLSPHPDEGNKKIYKQKVAMNEGKKRGKRRRGSGQCPPP